MKEKFRFKISYVFLMTILMTAGNLTGQTPAVTQSVTQPVTQPVTQSVKQQEDINIMPVINQFSYIQEHSKIYDNFRAIKEDVFQRLKKNVTDTINNLHGKMKNANISTATLNRTIDSLNSTLQTTKSSLAEMTRTKESMKLLGIEVAKDSYNTIMMAVIIVLLLVLLTGFLFFNRNMNLVNNRNKDLADLRAEFEAYRKTSREAREKMSLQHFNELKKLRGE